MGDDARATKLLEHAHGRARTSKVADTRVASELARLLEKAGRHGDALRVRKAALAMVSGPRVELLALRAVAAAAERAGELSEAVLALERARVLDADDATILEELDRLLVAAGRHEARAVLWMREAALADDARSKTRALLLAADAAADAGREVDAARHREAAWIADPSAPGVFDALAERLAPAGSADSVAARVELYAKAAERTKEVGTPPPLSREDRVDLGRRRRRRRSRGKGVRGRPRRRPTPAQRDRRARVGRGPRS